MDNTNTALADTKAKSSPSRSRHSRIYALIILLVVIGVGLIAGTYYSQKTRATKIASQNNSLRTQLSALSKKNQQQADVNNGIVPAGAIYKAPSGEIGLISGLITMTLPKGWTSLPESNCTGGTIASVAVCEDITAVTPSSLVNKDGAAKWSVSVAAYDYSGSASAKDWYYNTYEGSAYGQSTGITNESTTPINGYSSYSYSDQASPYSGTSDPEYTYAYYTVAHGKYAVVVSAQVQAGSSYGADAFDYTNTYQPLLDQMIKTIKFND